MANPNLRFAEITWTGRGMVFDGRAAEGPVIRVDGDGHEGPSPVTTLLIAAASCSASDVVSILEKMRITLRHCSIAVEAERRPDDPRRVIRLGLVFMLRGDGLDEARARRAIDLSIEKYCSVMHSLAPDIPITYTLDLG
jgi:putative redox protein